MTTPTLDRRDTPRFDLVSPLWAELELPEIAAVLNISMSGLLVESAACPALNARHVTTIRADGHTSTVTTIVRHVRTSPGGRFFLVGLEIPDTSAEHLVRDARTGTTSGRGPQPEAPAHEDRRRGVRLACGRDVWADLCWPRPVRLIDISASGVLLASRHRGSVGARGLLRLTVGTHTFSAAVELCRQTAYYDQSGFHLGLRFLGLLEHRRDLLDSLASGSE